MDVLEGKPLQSKKRAQRTQHHVDGEWKLWQLVLAKEFLWVQAVGDGGLALFPQVCGGHRVVELQEGLHCSLGVRVAHLVDEVIDVGILYTLYIPGHAAREVNVQLLSHFQVVLYKCVSVEEQEKKMQRFMRCCSEDMC